MVTPIANKPVTQIFDRMLPSSPEPKISGERHHGFATRSVQVRPPVDSGNENGQGVPLHGGALCERKCAGFHTRNPTVHQ
jgi:hypothetical protein